MAGFGTLPGMTRSWSWLPVKQSMRTLSVLAKAKDEAKALSPVGEPSPLAKLPYLGVRGLSGDAGLEEPAQGPASALPASWRPAAAGEGGSGRLGLFMAGRFSPAGRRGLSGMLTRVRRVVTLRVTAAKT